MNNKKVLFFSAFVLHCIGAYLCTFPSDCVDCTNILLGVNIYGIILFELYFLREVLSGGYN